MPRWAFSLLLAGAGLFVLAVLIFCTWALTDQSRGGPTIILPTGSPSITQGETP